MFNGAGFIYGQVPQLWIVDASTGEARRLTDLPSRVEAVAWSPDGKRLAFATNLAGDRDLGWRSDVHVVDVASGRLTRITGGRGYFTAADVAVGRTDAGRPRPPLPRRRRQPGGHLAVPRRRIRERPARRAEPVRRGTT